MGRMARTIEAPPKENIKAINAHAPDHPNAPKTRLVIPITPAVAKKPTASMSDRATLVLSGNMVEDIRLGI